MIQIKIKHCNKWEKLKDLHHDKKDFKLYAGELNQKNIYLILDN